MVNDGSLVGGSTQNSFNFDTQQGVMHLLSSVRAAQVSPEQKNELRDLVFLYANGGRDQSVRITLEQKLVKYGIAALAGNVKQGQPAKNSLFGTSRPAPSFSVVSNSSVATATQSQPTQQPTPAAPTPVAAPVQQPVTPPANIPTPTQQPVVQAVPPVPMPQPAQQPAPAPVTPPVPVSEPVTAPAAQPTPVTPAAPTPVAAPVQQPVTPPANIPTPTQQPVVQAVPPVPMPQPAQQPAPAPVTPPVPVSEPVTAQTPSTTQTPTPTPTSSIPVVPPEPPKDQAQNLQRIREIKSSVNEKVGNPVNLVDINNAVGREYMASLLDAMKKLNNGSSVVAAMKRLEEAYQLVEKTLADHRAEELVVYPQPTPIQSKSTAPAPEPTPAPNPTPEPKVVPVPVAPPTPEPTVQTEQKVASESPQAESNKSESELKSAKLPPLFSIPKPASSPTPVPTPAPLPSPSPIPTPPSPQEPDTVVKKQESAADTKEEVGSISSSWSTDDEKPSTKFTSVANSKSKPHTPADLQDPKSVESSSVSGNPLFTKEVDEGLQQLLAEWSLFKKSGLFGTGPKGREHPLFKKIAELQIPLLLAGRFEGATQEIKQSITDYMNGWRYEQGIVYQQGENFEHYLRRVIRHILDLQKSKQSS